MPTRRGAAFIATIVIMLLMSLNDALSLGFVVTFLLSGLVAAALLHAFRNLAGLEIRSLSAGETFAGSELPFTLVLAGAGTSRTAVTLATRDGVAVDVDVIPADGAVTVTVGLPVPRRGRYPLGRITLSSDYPLGLWHAWAYVHFPLAGIAFPAPERDAPPLPAGATGDDAGATARGDTADLAGLRGYQTGDPMQRIAWKAVARGAGWHTKLFEGRERRRHARSRPGMHCRRRSMWKLGSRGSPPGSSPPSAWHARSRFRCPAPPFRQVRDAIIAGPR